MIQELLPFLIIYIIGFYAMYKYMQIAYSKGGICENFNIDGFTLLLAILPVINTSLAIMLWIFDYPYKTPPEITRKFSLEKFFRVRK